MSQFKRRYAIVMLAAAASLLLSACGANQATPIPNGEASNHVPEDGYLFCFWNVENLFDDQHDNRVHEADKKFDDWFARDGGALQKKLARLCDALLALNQGRGPDILAVAEVESPRAAELLSQALNARLTDESLHYRNVLMKDPNGGRHIAPAILTRLPVRGDKTRLHGKHLRILEGHIVVNDHDLVVVASHWTSRISDAHGQQRAKYGDQIYGAYQAMHRSNPEVDFLVCGDFNDPPEAPSVTEHLHATGDLAAFRKSEASPALLNLMAGKDPASLGTHYYKSWWIFDQVAVSPGLLDERGWTCLPNSVKTINTLYKPNDRQHRPWAFGKESEAHGFSDHFPVTVRLKAAGK